MGYQIMANPTIRVHNIETDEVIDREMTDDEFVQHQANKNKSKIETDEAKAKLTARQAIADRLGLTVDELAVLLG
jgi:hypothetical protein